MIEKTLTVSAVICAYTFERLEDTVAAARSLEAQDERPHEIIVVVDHNAALLDVLRGRLSAEVTLIGNTFEKGLSGARNSGVARASGDLVFFLDDDAVADPHCLARLTAKFADPDVIGAGARIDPLVDGSLPGWFPEEYLWVVGCVYRGLRPGPVRNLLGAAMCVRREVFDRAGGFESSLGRSQSGLPFGCEETEFCIRATRVCGGRFDYEPEASVGHKVPPSRLTLAYFIRRCYAEGLSKARLSQLAGMDHSLSSERSYVARTLKQAFFRNLGEIFGNGDPFGLARAFALLLGLACAGAGFALGRAQGDGGSESPVFWRGWLAALGRERVLLESAALLAVGTGVAAVLGFVYWLIAARAFPAAAVGYAAAAISLMNFIGHLGEFGLGALMMGEVKKFESPHRFIASGLLVAALCSAAFGLAYAALNTLLGLDFGNIARGYTALAFALGCGLTSLTLVLDQALVGLSRSPAQALRNVAFAVCKLALLAAAPLLLAHSRLDETTILVSWLLGQLASILLLAACAPDAARRLLGRPKLSLLGPHVRDTLAHHGLNMANFAPGLLLPSLVVMVISPATNAAFYAAWTLINVAYLAPASLAQVVYAVGAEDRAELARRLRVSLGISMGAGVGVAIVCLVGAPFILSLFSPAYVPVASESLQLLGFSVFLIAIKYHYVAVQRVHNQMKTASLLVALGCVMELAGALVGGRHGQLFDLTRGWFLGLGCEVAIMAPVVIRALLSDKGRIAGGFSVGVDALSVEDRA